MRLLQTVSHIDTEAALYLLSDAWLEFSREAKDGSTYDSLSSAFTWLQTPQDHDYWARINSKANEAIQLTPKKSTISRKLLKQVATVDKEAAIWLLQGKFGPFDDRYNFSIKYKSLSDAFVWSDTPQGHDYWSEIQSAIEKKSDRS